MNKRTGKNTLKTPVSRTPIRALAALILVAALAAFAGTLVLSCSQQAMEADLSRLETAEESGLTLGGTEAGEAYAVRVYPMPETDIGGFADWAAATADGKLAAAGEAAAEGDHAFITLATPDGEAFTGTGVSDTSVFIVEVRADGETRYALVEFTDGAGRIPDWTEMAEPPPELLLDIGGTLEFPDTVIVGGGGQPLPTLLSTLLPTQPEALTVTLTNAGANPTGLLTVSIDGDAGVSGTGASGTSVFELLTDEEIEIEAGETADIVIRPLEGLGVGTYTATVRVSMREDSETPVPWSALADFAVSYRVVEAEEAGTRSIDLGVKGYHEFPAMTEGGLAQPLAVIVTNTGTEETGRLAVTLSGYDTSVSGTDGNSASGTSAFVLSDTAIANIPVGGSFGFSVEPAIGLAAGLHTATVTVASADSTGEGAALAPQSFTVIIEVGAMPVCRVSFDAKGGVPAPREQTVRLGRTATAPASVTRNGLRFKGWHIADGSPFSFGTPVTADITLYAKWEARVSFNANGGTNAPAPVSVDEGGTLAEPATAPVRASYSFVDWFKDAEGTTRWVFGTDAVTRDTTLYAKWTRHTFRVTFSTNMAPAPAAYDVALGGRITRPLDTKAGYAMDGWYTSAGSWDFSSDTVTGDITLLGYWRAAIAVTFSLYEGQTSQTAVAEGSPVKRPDDPERTGYVFAGWYAAGASVPYDFDSPVNAALTLEARWTPRTYTVSFNTGGIAPTPAAIANVQHGGTVAAPAPVKAGYTLDGWYRQADGTERWDFDWDTVTGETTLYGFWRGNTYTVRFDTGGIAPVPAPAVSVPHNRSISAPDAVKTGYYLDGWYTTATGTAKWDFANGITGDMTLYGHWKPNDYTVSFNASGGTFGTPALASQSVAHGSLAADPAPSRPDLRFKGWKKADGTMFSLSAPVTGNLNLAAVWETDIVFNLNGGTLNGNTGVVLRTLTLTEAAATVARPADPAKTGLRLRNWYAGDGTPFNFGTAVTGPILINALWEADVSFDLNEGTQAPSAGVTPRTLTLTEGSKAQEPAKPTRGADWEFDGWYTAASGGTKWDFSAAVTRHTPLYARWTRLWKVRLYRNRGWSGEENETYRMREGTVYTPPNISLSQYTFGGWFTDAAMTKKVTSVTVAADTEFHAKWTMNPNALFHVAYNLNGGFWDDVLDADVPKLPKAPPGGTVRLSAPRREGYSFQTWYLDSALTQIAAGESVTIEDRPVSVYAKWKWENSIAVYIKSGVMRSSDAGVQIVYQYSIPYGGRLLDVPLKPRGARYDDGTIFDPGDNFAKENKGYMQATNGNRVALQFPGVGQNRLQYYEYRDTGARFYWGDRIYRQDGRGKLILWGVYHWQSGDHKHNPMPGWDQDYP
jgi:uncharacterized repeat protein (TIGR02543 family)